MTFIFRPWLKSYCHETYMLLLSCYILQGEKPQLTSRANTGCEWQGQDLSDFSLSEFYIGLCTIWDCFTCL